MIGLEVLKQALNDGKTAEAREAFEKAVAFFSPEDAKRFQQALEGDLGQSKVQSLMAEMLAAGVKMAVQLVRKRGAVSALLFGELATERERTTRNQTKSATEAAQKKSNKN